MRNNKIFAGMLIFMLMLIVLCVTAGCSILKEEKYHCQYYSVFELAEDDACNSEDLG